MPRKAAGSQLCVGSGGMAEIDGLHDLQPTPRFWNEPASLSCSWYCSGLLSIPIPLGFGLLTSLKRNVRGEWPPRVSLQASGSTGFCILTEMQRDPGTPSPSVNFGAWLMGYMAQLQLLVSDTCREESALCCGQDCGRLTT